MTRQELIQQIKQKQTFLCVGLDPDIQKIPQAFIDLVKKESPNDESALGSTLYSFCAAVADATAPYCVAFKPNLAFFEAHGLPGLHAYDTLIRHLRQRHPHHLLIADAKRGDIGNTSAMYARSAFEGPAQVDAITVAPYMGEDSVKPFLQYPDKWVILLALTSNKGSQDFQLTTLNSQPSTLNSQLSTLNAQEEERLFERVLKTSQQWGTDEQMMYVVGATQGQMFQDVRRLAPRHFLLVPGVGAQGGSLHDVCRYGMTPDCGLLVNSSRGIIYASSGPDFVAAATRAAQDLQQQMARELEQLAQ